MAYHVEIPGLDAAVFAAPVEENARHGALLKALRRLPDLADARLVTHRGDAWRQRRKVLSSAGALVADDHESWLQQELARDAGHAPTTMRRLRDLDYRLTVCAIDTLYIVHDRGQAQDNFLQVEVDVEDEFVERRLFSSYAWHSSTPRDLRDLVREAEDGDRLDDRVRYRPSTYALKRAFDAGAFLREASEHETTKREANRAKLVNVSVDGGPSRTMSVGELAPEAGVYQWPGRRLISDWTLSSAGRAGKRFCHSWALQIADYTSPQGERSMSVIPLWTHTRKMAAIERGPKSTYELFGKLESLDRRLDVPFAWYFYMLHGNLVRDWAGERVLEAAESGKIVLPEHDYQVLKRWSAWPYGF